MDPQLFTKPDGNVMQLLGDLRLWAAAGGAVSETALEKLLWTSFRGAFGYAVEVNGTIMILSQEEYQRGLKASEIVTKARLDLLINRQLARGAGIVAALALIETTKGQGSGVAALQFGALGFAAVAAAHIFMDLVPRPFNPARQ